MPEFRHDPVSGRWVIIAGNRAGRPEEFRRAPAARVEVDCPFCRGQEHRTTPAVAVYPDGAAPGEWEVRVIANKYPALAAEDTLAWKDDWRSDNFHAAGDVSRSLDAALFTARPGFGRHEVVVESPTHVESFSALSDNQAFWTFAAYRDRLRLYAADPRFAAAAVFKNVGADGGASLIHAHSQILMLPATPDALAREVKGAAQFHHRHGVCVFCAMIEREAKQGVRFVGENERFVAFCPFASHFAYETWIVPRRHEPHFATSDDETLRSAASLLKRVILAVEDILDRPAFNYFLHTSPFDTNACDHYHWHIEFFPRISKSAGFEWSAGWRLNTTPPERAAASLRNALRRLG